MRHFIIGGLIVCWLIIRVLAEKIERLAVWIDPEYGGSFDG